MLRAFLRVSFLTILAASLVGSAEVKEAQGSPADQSLAQSLFDQARQLMDQGKFDEACPKLAESQRLDPGGGTLLNLAACYEKGGKTGSAWAQYNIALSQAVTDGRPDREQFAKQRIAVLGTVVPRITVVVPVAAVVEGLEVKLDGMLLRAPAWGIGTVVDPGRHVVEASAPGRVAWSTDAYMSTPGENRQVLVPTLVMVNQQQAAQPAPAPQVVSSPYIEIDVKSRSFWHYAGYTVAIGGLAVSSMTGYAALSAHTKAKSECNVERAYCRPGDGLDNVEKAHSYAWASTITLGVGLGAWIFAAALPLKTERKRIHVGATPVGGHMAIDWVF